MGTTASKDRAPTRVEQMDEREEWTESALREWLAEHDFSSLSVVDALHALMVTKRLPGESQRIDIFMQLLTDRMLECTGGVIAPETHPDLKVTADDVYVLLFSLLMLSTDLHSPQVRAHMTEPEFKIQLRGTRNGEDYPQDFVVGLYREIQREAIGSRQGQSTRSFPGTTQLTKSAAKISSAPTVPSQPP
mmetsp:Transcript_68744/g.161631  ORF Transcript_68744/g.161631 Transcript_68744/m.161631 type:complete len:190 (-) Transcript_68744:42-611(-)